MREGGVVLGLCLYVFASDLEDDDDPEEVAECDVGHYSDFGCFRDTIADRLGAKRFPTLMNHSDCDGEWTLEEIPVLERELRDWQRIPETAGRGSARRV